MHNRGTLQEVLTCQDSIHNDMEQEIAKYFGSALDGKKKKVLENSFFYIFTNSQYYPLSFPKALMQTYPSSFLSFEAFVSAIQIKLKYKQQQQKKNYMKRVKRQQLECYTGKMWEGN